MKIDAILTFKETKNNYDDNCNFYYECFEIYTHVLCEKSKPEYAAMCVVCSLLDLNEMLNNISQRKILK